MLATSLESLNDGSSVYASKEASKASKEDAEEMSGDKSGVSGPSLFLQPGTKAPTFTTKAVLKANEKGHHRIIEWNLMEKLYELRSKAVKEASDLYIVEKTTIQKYGAQKKVLLKYLIILFYPSDFSPVSVSEIIAFNEMKERFEKEGCEIVAISGDKGDKHKQWMEASKNNLGLNSKLKAPKANEIGSNISPHEQSTPAIDKRIQKEIVPDLSTDKEMKIPLLTDKDGSIAKTYGLYNSAASRSFRGIVIIDHDRTIRHISINDSRVGVNPSSILRQVQAYRHSDITGEVCPSMWQPGLRAMCDSKLGASIWAREWLLMNKKRKNTEVKREIFKGSYPILIL